ncbi:hypothetical protein J1N35_013914 [Gossypium stocksii]|uniref:Uncharacterized protein n=1 Tax=Gossypium stocksii TaxID=47602 RepID=A0A9D4A748_9ROSI|nr:hypothetical protein J1N35_013914 [Gossypium stocksii]
MAPRDLHFSFAVWGVHYHPGGCCTVTQTPNRQKCDNGHGEDPSHFTSTFYTQLEPSLEPEPTPDPELSHTQSRDRSYHPDLRADDYFPSSSGHGYHSKFFGPNFNIPDTRSSMTFDIFRSLPP